MSAITLTPYDPDTHRQAAEAIFAADPAHLADLAHFPHVTLAYVGDTPAGLLAHAEPGMGTWLQVYVAPRYRRRGVGAALMARAHDALAAAPIVERATSSCPRADAESIQFFYKQGFYISFCSHLMTYAGPPLAHPPLDVRPYEDADYLTWSDTIQSAFYGMRNRVGILPAFWMPPSEAGRRERLARREDGFVLWDGGEIVGVGAIDGPELDVVCVAPAHQGKGYGRAFVAYLVNVMLARGEKEICLWAVDGNPAKGLYEAMGFAAQRLEAFLVRYYRPDSRPSRPPEGSTL